MSVFGDVVFFLDYLTNFFYVILNKNYNMCVLVFELNE